MVEVFKTNVNNPDHARVLIVQIKETFPNYEANFDLDDCDKILRIKATRGPVRASDLLDLLQRYGYDAEVLEDGPATIHHEAETNKSSDEMIHAKNYMCPSRFFFMH